MPVSPTESTSTIPVTSETATGTAPFLREVKEEQVTEVTVPRSDVTQLMLAAAGLQLKKAGADLKMASSEADLLVVCEQYRSIDPAHLSPAYQIKFYDEYAIALAGAAPSVRESHWAVFVEKSLDHHNAASRAVRATIIEVLKQRVFEIGSILPNLTETPLTLKSQQQYYYRFFELIDLPDEMRMYLLRTSGWQFCEWNSQSAYLRCFFESFFSDR